MPNIKSAKKAIKTIEKKRINNNEYRASLKTAIKNLERSIAANDKNASQERLQIVIKRVDKAASKGVVTPNYVARTKSRLTKKVNEMK